MVPVLIDLTLWRKTAGKNGKTVAYVSCLKVVCFPCLPAAETVLTASDEFCEIDEPRFNLVSNMYHADTEVECIADDTPEGEQKWNDFVGVWQRAGFKCGAVVPIGFDKE